MSPKLDTATHDCATTRPQLRDDLKVSFKTEGGEPFCVIEDSVQNRFFHVGFAEYTLISLFDGKTTLSEAVKASAYVLGSDALGESDAVQICHWMVSNGLAQTRASVSSDRLVEKEVQQSKKLWNSFKNPLMVQMPIFNPDRFFTSITPLFQWMISWFGLLIWMLVVGAGAYLFATSENKMGESLSRIISSNQWVSILLIGVSLKCIHELAHGVACKHYGGRVNEFGLFWFLFIPLPYLDVSSSWAFELRYRRMLVAGAGILAELFVVGVCLIIWAKSDLGWSQQMTAQTVLLGSMITILFNANPLMRFDGYFLLSDSLRIPNLSIHGRQWILNRLKSLFFGMTVKPGKKSFLIPFYGILALAWQVLVVVSLLLAASNLMTGVGLLLALTGVTAWLLIPLTKLLNYLAKSPEIKWGQRFRFAVTLATCGSLFYLAMTIIPSPETIAVHAVVKYQDEATLRNSAAGLVEKVYASDNQPVTAGQPIIRLCNPELKSQQNLLLAEKEIIQFEIRMAKNENEIGLVSSLKQRLALNDERLHQVNKRLSELVVVAPKTGQLVMDKSIRQLKGTFLHSGTEICQIVDPARKELVGLVSEADSAHLMANSMSRVSLLVWGAQTIAVPPSKLQLSPTSSRKSPHFALTSLAGGQHTVVETVGHKENRKSWKLADSYFEIKYELPSSMARQFHQGQTCLLRIRARHQSFGQYIWETSQKWFREKVSLAHGI